MSELTEKLDAIVDCVNRAAPKDVATVRRLLSESYPNLAVTKQDARALLELLDRQRFVPVLQPAPTSFVIQVLRALLVRYGAAELKEMVDAMG